MCLYASRLLGLPSVIGPLTPEACKQLVQVCTTAASRAASKQAADAADLGRVASGGAAEQTLACCHGLQQAAGRKLAGWLRLLQSGAGWLALLSSAASWMSLLLQQTVFDQASQTSCMQAQAYCGAVECRANSFWLIM